MRGLVHTLVESQQPYRLARLSGKPHGTRKVDRIESAQRMRLSQLACQSHNIFRHFNFQNIDIVGVQSGNALAVLGAGRALLAQDASQCSARLCIRNP